MAEVKRIGIGFQGGHTLPVRVNGPVIEQLVKALMDDNAARWHMLETEDSSVLLDLSQVIYVQGESGDHKVGF